MLVTPFYPKTLPVLEALKGAFLPSHCSLFHNTLLVCVQHLLYTTIHLLDSCVELGIEPSHIHILGKSYSFNKDVFTLLQQKGYHCYSNTPQKEIGYFDLYFKKDVLYMWSSVMEALYNNTIESIIILDDGGKCLVHTPKELIENYRVVGIEQTTSGLKQEFFPTLSFPIIEVATSAVKQQIESPMIAEAVVKKILPLLPSSEKNPIYGVVGLGVIGQALITKLAHLQCNILVYDKMQSRIDFSDKRYSYLEISDLLVKADYIFGCTGFDITEEWNLDSITKSKTLISCSSQDKEFLTLLRKLQNIKDSATPIETILNDIIHPLQSGNILSLLRGGFPINLDNSGESVPPMDIQLTRGLLFGAIIQASSYISHKEKKNAPIRFMLDPSLQRFVVKIWKNYGSTLLFTPEFLENFACDSWIMHHSKGKYDDSGYFDFLS